jgi:hypothetical protein
MDPGSAGRTDVFGASARRLGTIRTTPLAREGVTVMIHDRCAAQCRPSAGQSIRHGTAAGMNIHHNGGAGLVRV